MEASAWFARAAGLSISTIFGDIVRYVCGAGYEPKDQIAAMAVSLGILLDLQSGLYVASS